MVSHLVKFLIETYLDFENLELFNCQITTRDLSLDYHKILKKYKLNE
jgi:hypothetical protein